MNQINLPVLFIIFNRSEVALKSFQSIRRLKPKQLFIASDGARKNVQGEELIVQQTRDLVLSEVDWECDIKTLFQEDNLGCGLGVYSAIEWFFKNVSYGVILEDDCIAEDTFFSYAYEMLKKYEYDERIGMIAGTNPIDFISTSYSIIFSKYKSCWGWGTWRRAWKNIDINLDWRNNELCKSILANCGFEGKDAKVWMKKIEYIDKGYVSAWDWQWYFSLAAQNQLCIYPKLNQISNIGNDENATHTSFSEITYKTSKLQFPLNLPPYVVANYDFDKKFYGLSQTLKARFKRILPHRIKTVLKKMIRRCQK